MNRKVLSAGLACFLVVFLAIGLWLRAAIAPEWYQPAMADSAAPWHPWAVEADCYSQLARVQRILHGQGLIQNHFQVENWPQGLVPSTTAPFDYCILLLYAPLTLFTGHPLDWAGALVSPALWLGLACFWFFYRSTALTNFGRCLIVLGSAALPALIWATAFGRPRHQSLILVLMAIGLTAEYERWSVALPARRRWEIAAGIAWGFACWTSLFEPLLVLALLVIFNLIFRRRESPVFLVSLGWVMLAALLLEHVHVFIPTAQDAAPLARWLATIAEVRGLDFATLSERLTLILICLPFVAWGLLRRSLEWRTDLFLVVLTTLLVFISAWQSRWIYYASLGELILVVRFCQQAPMHWARLLIMLVFIAGLIDGDVTEISSSSGQAASNQPSPQLEQIARAINQPGGILAPWWLSPGLLYFSGQPIVSGSSHCGISGIVDSAKFYTATSWVEADRILQQRQVRWVVVYDNPRYVYPLLNSSGSILGLEPFTDDTKVDAEKTITQILFNDRFVPGTLRLRAVTPELKLYEYLPNAG